LWDGVSECQYCAGEFGGSGDHQGHATVDALDDAAPDALPDGGTEIVWTASTGAGQSIDTYHTDRDCPSLGAANTIVERERNVLPDRATHCLVCQDRLDEHEYDPDWSYQAALRDHNAEDLVTDGGARFRSKADANTGELSRAGVVNWPKPEKEYVDLVQLLKADIQTDGGRLRHDHIVAAVLEGRRRPSDRLRDGIRADGSGLPGPDRSEQERRARQAATSLVAWSRRAEVDPASVLQAVRDGLPRTDGGDPDHYCEICERPFETIARLIKHDCEDPSLVPDGGDPGKPPVSIHAHKRDDYVDIQVVADDEVVFHAEPLAEQATTVFRAAMYTFASHGWPDKARQGDDNGGDAFQ
jgi:hypothetical protein